MYDGESLDAFNEDENTSSLKAFKDFPSSLINILASNKDSLPCLHLAHLHFALQAVHLWLSL
jgi:hypothetical protein